MPAALANLCVYHFLLPSTSFTGYRYYLVLLDDFTHFVWTFPLRHKSEVAAKIISFHAYIRTQFARPIRAIQTDNGREFDNSDLRKFYSDNGILLRLSCPYTSQQNGKAERILRTLNDGVHTLLLHSAMPPIFWVEALQTSAFLLNRKPCKPRSMATPFLPALQHRTRLCISSRFRMSVLPKHRIHQS